MDFDLSASDWNTGAEQDWVYGNYADYGNYNDLVLAMSWMNKLFLINLLRKVFKKFFNTF